MNVSPNFPSPRAVPSGAGGRLNDLSRLCKSRGLIFSNTTTVCVCLFCTMDYFSENWLHVVLITVTLDGDFL